MQGIFEFLKPNRKQVSGVQRLCKQLRIYKDSAIKVCEYILKQQ